MKSNNTILILLGSSLGIFSVLSTAHGSVMVNEITPAQTTQYSWTGANGNSEPAPAISWTRPTSASNAASSLTTYAEWSGLAVTAATNKPTGNSYFGTSLSSVPTAGDSSSTTSGAFLIANGTANNAYYSNTQTGDIYSFSGVITPQITAPTYDITGNQLNVLVQVEQDGQQIDTSKLTVNGVPASTLANYGVSETYTDGGSPFGGFGTAYRNDYAWTFTLPNDPASLQLNFGWGVTSAAFTDAAIDTQSVTASVPEPASIGLLGGSALMLLGRRRRA